jgi:hypothetical protein
VFRAGLAHVQQVQAIVSPRGLHRGAGEGVERVSGERREGRKVALGWQLRWEEWAWRGHGLLMATTVMLRTRRFPPRRRAQSRCARWPRRQEGARPSRIGRRIWSCVSLSLLCSLRVHNSSDVRAVTDPLARPHTNLQSVELPMEGRVRKPAGPALLQSPGHGTRRAQGVLEGGLYADRCAASSRPPGVSRAASRPGGHRHAEGVAERLHEAPIAVPKVDLRPVRPRP